MLQNVAVCSADVRVSCIPSMFMQARGRENSIDRIFLVLLPPRAGHQINRDSHSTVSLSSSVLQPGLVKVVIICCTFDNGKSGVLVISRSVMLHSSVCTRQGFVR